jgi:zinc D-Ala-D-Ala dipeptidase
MVKRIVGFLFCGWVLFSCSSSSDQKVVNSAVQAHEDSLVRDSSDSILQEELARSLKLDSLGLVNIQDYSEQISIDLKYASTDNFLHQQLYFKFRKAYLQKEVAIRLSACQQFLDSIRPGYKLLVLDAVRPLAVQGLMWKALDSIPVWRRTRFVSNPANGSIHNYGAAVDITIIDESSKWLDMGAGYDDIREIAYPKYEQRYLDSGLLTLKQIENRRLLRKVMRSQRFFNISTEWWHFNACSRMQAKEKYPILLDEF